MHTEVRPAVAADLEALSDLQLEARTALTDVRGGAKVLAEQPAADWATVLADPLRRVWVAVIDEVVLGYLELELPGTDGTGRVRQVYVHPEARELGFGDELLAAAIEAIVDAGGTEVESWALPGDRDTKNLFERAGVTARKLVVSKRLG